MDGVEVRVGLPFADDEGDWVRDGVAACELVPVGVPVFESDTVADFVCDAVPVAVGD